MYKLIFIIIFIIIVFIIVTLKYNKKDHDNILNTSLLKIKKQITSSDKPMEMYTMPNFEDKQKNEKKVRFNNKRKQRFIDIDDNNHDSTAPLESKLGSYGDKKWWYKYDIAG